MGQDTLRQQSQTGEGSQQQQAVGATTAEGAVEAQQPAVAVRHTANAVVRPTTQTELSIYLQCPADSVAVDTAAEREEGLMVCNDSLFAPYAGWEAPVRKSMFASREPNIGRPLPLQRQVPASTDWIFGTLTLLIALTSIYLNNQKFKLKDILQSLFDIRTMERVFRENNLKPRSLLPMTCIYLGSLTLVANEMLRETGGIELFRNALLQYAVLCGGVIVYYLIKNEVIRMFGALFENRHASMIYICSNYLFYFIGGLGATPMALVYFFAPGGNDGLLIALGIFVCIVFVLRMLRGLQLILTNSKSSRLYLFYYLCIVEIVPILIVIKSLIS